MSVWKRCSASPCGSWPAGEPAGRGGRSWPPTARSPEGFEDGDVGRAARHRSDPVEPEEELEEVGLRPRSLEEFVGQAQLVEHLGIVLQAARQRRQAVDHILFAGPPGLGKTSLAGIVATEMARGIAHHRRSRADPGR